MSQNENYMMMNTLGMEVLIHTFRDASHLFTRTLGYTVHPALLPKNKLDRYLRESKESYLFIQGTGLELAIQFYQLDYDAERLRNCFNYLYKVKHDKLHHLSSQG